MSNWAVLWTVRVAGPALAAQVATMAKTSQAPPAGPVPGVLPEVQLEVRQAGRTLRYEQANLEFLVGTVPGCDLRLPGPDLPPLLCLLTRHPEGLRLRKLAPTQI